MKTLAQIKYTALLIIFSIFINSCNTAMDKESNYPKDNSTDKEKIDKRKLAFQNDGLIGFYDFATGKTKDLTKGFDPCISPDGKWIAYTYTSSPGTTDLRIIKLINTENSAIKDLGINDNKPHYGAIWSPTAEYLAFNILINDSWQLGLSKPNGSKFKIISTDSNFGLHEPTWSQDGKYILAHDLTFLYKFDTTGKLIDKYDLAQLFEGKFSFSSATRFCLTSDNQQLIFDGGIHEFVEGLEEISSALFAYNFNTKSTKRITKKGLCTTNFWLDNQDLIYFSGFENINEARKIYQTSLSDTTLTEITNGMNPSVGQ